MALDLARRGYDLILHYAHSEAEATATAAEIRELGRSCRLVAAGLQSEQETLDFCAGLQREGLNPRVIVNSAMGYGRNTALSVRYSDLVEATALGSVAPVILTRELLAGRPGSLAVNILDARLDSPDSAHFAYNGAKALLAFWTAHLARELAPEVRVNAIAPGFVLPPDGISRDAADRLSTANHLRRRLGPEDVLHALGYLLEAQYATGQIIYVDGGRHLGSVTESR